MSPGEVIEVARAMRAIGAAGFKYREFEVTFYEPLPLELQVQDKNPDDDDDEEDDETPQKKVARLRKQLADADTFGAS